MYFPNCKHSYFVPITTVFSPTEIKCPLEVNTDVVARLGNRGRSLFRKLGFLHSSNSTSYIPERYFLLSVKLKANW